MKTNDMKRARRLFSRIVLSLGVILFAGLLSSCYKDKGTDFKDYVPLFELRVDTAGTGARSSYIIKRGEDLLEIAPDVWYKGQKIKNVDINELPLSFEWTLYRTPTIGVTNYPVDLLSEGPSVRALINRGSGVYTCLFTVTHRETGIQDYCSFEVTVEGDLPTNGYLILYETPEGNSEVGIISNDWINAAVLTDRTLLDLYYGTNGEPLPGKPIAIRQSERCTGSGEALIATESNYVGLNYEELSVTYTASELFNDPPRGNVTYTYQGIGGNPGWNSATQTREYVIVDNSLYYTPRGNTQSTRLIHTKLGVPMGGTYGELAPWLPMIVLTNNWEAVVYDQTHMCFRYVAMNGTTILTFAQETQTIRNNAFDITGTGMEMITSDWGFRTVGAAPPASQFYEYSLMKSGGDRAILVSSWSIAAAPRAAAKFNVNGYPGIENATMIAANAAGPSLYYSDGNAVYLTVHNVGARTIQPAVEFWTPPAGEVVTKMVIHKNASQMKTHPIIASGFFFYDNQLLYIATWNEATGVGSVHQMRINPTTGQRVSDGDGVIPVRVFTGFGKIKDMCWRWPV
jgi:hypothetical protein